MPSDTSRRKDDLHSMAPHFHRHGGRQDGEGHPVADVRSARALRSVWTLIGICILVVIIAIIIGSISTAIWTLVAAGIIVFILRRPVRWFKSKGVPRGLSAAILLVLLIAAILAVFISFVPLIADQLGQLANALPGYISQAQEWWSGFVADHPELAGSDTAQGILSTIASSISNAVSQLQSVVVSSVYQAGVSIANILMYGIMSFLVAFWILLDYDRMAHEIHILAGRNAEWYLILVSTIFSRVLGGFLRGTIITAILIAIISGIGYMIAGLPFAMVLGILMGIFSIVPYLGPVIAGVIVCVLAIFSGPIAFFISLVVSIVVPWVVSSFVSPRIMSSTVNLHPGIIMVAIIAGGAVGSIVGMILAVPVAAAAKCLIVYFFEAITGRQLIGKEGAVFAGNPTDMIDPVADATDNFLTSEKLRAMVEEVEEGVRKVENAGVRGAGSLFQELAQPLEHISARKIEGGDSADDPQDEDAEEDLADVVD